MEFGTSLVTVGFVLLCVWVTILTVFVFRMIRHYNTLTKGVSRLGLKDVLESIVSTQGELKKHVNALTVEVGKTNKAGELHIQRIGIVRFNPFADTGGSQSFTMAILDGVDNGIVITSLYARNSNRWYVKEVEAGAGKGVALAKEEESAIKKAKRI